MSKKSYSPKRKRLPVDWLNASSTVVLTQASPNQTLTLFNTDALTMTSPFQETKSVLIRRILIRVLASATCSLANQLIHLALTALVRRANEAQFNAAFTTVEDQISSVVRTEVRTIQTGTAGVPQCYDLAGGTPWTFDAAGRRLGGNDNLVLSCNGYVAPWTQPLPGVTTIGVDMQIRVAFSILSGGA